ncbi:MAG: hypothetical protein NZM29_03420 [Nitrospira sp.]|nr:hypothetical protein [Nitrospira sp.]
MTEHAAMELSAHLQALASKDGSAAESDRAASLSRIVVAMQFQDITRQRLGHVGQALEEWRGYFQALLEETRAGHSSVRPLDQESMERDFVLMEARCSSIKAVSEGAVKTETAGGGSAESGQVSESVTIF